MEEKIKEIIADVFGIDKESINEKTTPDTIETWDSLRHMNLVVAFEEEFEIEFDDDEIGELLNLKNIVEVITKKTK